MDNVVAAHEGVHVRTSVVPLLLYLNTSAHEHTHTLCHSNHNIWSPVVTVATVGHCAPAQRDEEKVDNDSDGQYRKSAWTQVNQIFLDLKNHCLNKI